MVLLTAFVSVTAFSQEKAFSILGKVVDSASGQPMAGASAFCQNTTQGTVSNNEGLFYLRLPNGGYDLVVSYTGYDKKVMRISNTQSLTDTMLIRLVKTEKSLEEVAVVGTNEVADGWKKYGQFFIDNFIGTTPNAASCQLQNPEVLHFYYSKKKNRLKVRANEDIIVRNYALGYTIRYQLDSFTYEYGTRISQYTGYPLFQEMDSAANVKEQWVKNRARSYLGSRLHFMRSMSDSTVTDEGFHVEKLDDAPGSTRGVMINNLYDSSLYASDSNGIAVGWKGRYRVSYKSVLPDPKFLKEFKLPANTRYQVTVLDVADGFVIEENGYFYEQADVVNSGYWAWEKLAELLPYDYTYE